MSDSTATAREPSMEDILASIRRIIDEEDTRDARPTSDMAVDDAGDGDDAGIGASPVMAPIPTGRDDAHRADAEDADQGDAIFPERESLFWSRATGRGDAPDEGGEAQAEAPDGPRTDIFRRAQSKLGAAQRPGARERIQSLAARAEERTESAAHERGSLAELEGLSDRAESDRAWDDAMEEGPEHASTVAAFADAHSFDDGPVDGAASGDGVALVDGPDDTDAAPYPSLDASDVLDLTEPLDSDEPSGEDVASFDTALREDAGARFDGLSDDEDRMDIARDDLRGTMSGAVDAATGHDPEALRGMFATGETGDARSDDDAGGDVLDLTTSLDDDGQEPEDRAAVDAGNVENGDSFHVSDVPAEEETRQGVEDEAVHEPEARDDDAVEDTIAPVDVAEEDEHPDAILNTYSRFDHDRPAESGDAGPADDSPDHAEPVAFAGAVAEDEDEDVANHADWHRAGPDEDADIADHHLADSGNDAVDDDVAGHGASDDDTVDDGTVDDDAVGYRAPDDDTEDSDTTGHDAADDDDAPLSFARVEEDDPAPAGTDRASAPVFDAPDDADDYAAAFTMLDDQLPAGDCSQAGETARDDERADDRTDDRDRLDDLDMGDELGFSDTFSASDVYHDDPPALDEDYSRSLEVEDEPAAAHSAHDDDEAHDAPRDDDARDRGMEKVGGLVRDAMERDPVDYADPSALVSMTSEEISARALASLADVEGEASRRMFGSLRISDDDGSESLEGMVRGMLRPLLREWLDDNLPSMVESAVRGEVERISAKSRKYSRAADRD